ncbi:MAG: aminopeptidase P family protein [Desulfobacterales bacterium]|nr:aminopeptidase P family protein [Desulfobacterales bacterium]
MQRENFMGLGKDQVKFVGHGVGLELDEFPVFAKGLFMKLEKGMTFAIEPTFVFPDGAVGIENTFVLWDDGVEKLTLYDENVIKL